MQAILLMFLSIFEIDDNLVKLASLGATGVSVLAIFVTGVIIYRLPNNVSKEKSGLLKYYLVTCLIFAVLSGASGVLNAMFNKSETDLKAEEKAAVVKQYQEESQKWVDYRGVVEARLTKMQQAIQGPTVNKAALANELKELSGTTRKIGTRPLPGD